MNLKQEIKEGRHAKTILEDPLYILAFDGLRESIISKIEDCPLQDNEIRDKLMLSLQLLKQIKRSFQTTMETGQLAEIQLTKE